MKTTHCYECAFYHSVYVDPTGHQEAVGECRRYPPRYVAEIDANDWAPVKGSDWCGEGMKDVTK